MKKHLLLLAALLVGLTACEAVHMGNEDEHPQEAEESVIVSLAMAGDITIMETPLSKAAGAETESKDIYGISVYYDKEKDGNIDDVYGYGLFDNVADMKISLLTGYKYKFVCSMVKDGKDKLGVYNSFNGYINNSGTSEETGYGYPFCKHNGSYKADSYDYNMNQYTGYSALTPIKNEFILGGIYHLTGLGNGATHDIENYSSSQAGYNTYTFYPKTERYYGEVTNYTPVQGGTVSLNMKKCVFGVQINVSGLTDGTLSAHLKLNTYSEDIVSFYNLATDGTVIPETVLTFNDVYDCWLQDTYSLESYLHVTWTRGNNVRQTLETQTVTLKRNVLTTININLVGSSSDSGFSLDLEDDEMTNEDIVVSDNDIIEFKDPNFLKALLTVQEFEFYDAETDTWIYDYMMDVDANKDGKISVNEAKKIKGLWLYDYETNESFDIKEMSEIKYFTALEFLECSYNQLATLDVSNNTALIWLSCEDNKLASLDLSKNTALMTLVCAGNQLTTLDMSNNLALYNFWCGNNQLTSLNVSKNAALEYLDCPYNQLTSLDVSGCTLPMDEFWCNDNPLTKVIMSANHKFTDYQIERIINEYGNIIEYR